MRFLLDWGIQQLFGGARQGNRGMAGIGAAVSLFAWLRTRRGPERELLWAADLEEGETVKIRFLQGRTVVDETEVEG